MDDVNPPGAAGAVTSLRATTAGAGVGIALAALAVMVGTDAWALWGRTLADGSAVAVGTGLPLIASTAGTVVCGWLSVLLLLGAATTVPGPTLRAVRSTGRRLAPRWAPRIGAALLTVTVGGPVAASAAPIGPVTPATAAQTTPVVDGRPIPERAASPPEWEAPVPGWESSAPDAGDTGEAPEPGWRPTSSPLPPAATVETGLVTRGTEPDRTVVVRSGDTLWGIVARHLGADAGPEVVAREWPRWHRANRQVIGPDPDLIHPGQELVPPGATS